MEHGPARSSAARRTTNDLDFVNKYRLGNTPWCAPRTSIRNRSSSRCCYDGDGRMINSRFLDGMTIEQAKEEVAKRLESELRGRLPSDK